MVEIENTVRVLVRLVTDKIERQGDGNPLANDALTDAKALLADEEPVGEYRSREEALYNVRERLRAYLSL